MGRNEQVIIPSIYNIRKSILSPIMCGRTENAAAAEETRCELQSLVAKIGPIDARLSMSPVALEDRPLSRRLALRFFGAMHFFVFVFAQHI